MIEDNAEKLLETNTNGNLKKQIYVVLLASSLQVVNGFNMSYTSAIVPQLIDEKNILTSKEISWIVSANSLGTFLGGLFAGLVVDRFGRVKIMKLSAIPTVISWFLIAVAPSVEMVTVGLFFSGLSLSFMMNSVYVYAVEVARPNIRGMLQSLSTLCISVGLLIMFVEGRFFHWRWIAWVTIAYTLTITILLFFIPESPPWLFSKNRAKEASYALNWFSVNESPETSYLEEDASLKPQNIKWTTFTQPTVYKPFFTICGLFVFQQFSGVFAILANCVMFFIKMDVMYDPYLITILVGIVRLTSAVGYLWLSKTFNRRTLLFVSGFRMTIAMVFSSITTRFMDQNHSVKTWFQVVLIMLYFFCAGCGLCPAPFTLSAELFPLHVRGFMQSLSLSFCNLISFTSLYLYEDLFDFFGGIVNVLYFYALISLTFVVYVFVFVPETHNKTLKEIEKYFG
ncbi:hypothetical protein FQR65_LT11322 [Abscondita terminalis]|nr:hypothetical protein FQR65_LT11322 [Abscondita terminalis]